VRFAQTDCFPGVVEDEGSTDDVADPARADCDVRQSPPSLLEFDGGTLTESPEIPQQRVEHTGVGVKRLFGLSLGRRTGIRIPMPAAMY
jgi:hypothetical protein